MSNKFVKNRARQDRVIHEAKNNNKFISGKKRKKNPKRQDDQLNPIVPFNQEHVSQIAVYEAFKSLKNLK